MTERARKIPRQRQTAAYCVSWPSSHVQKFVEFERGMSSSMKNGAPVGAPTLSRNASARPRLRFDEPRARRRRCAQPPRPPRPSLSICCHQADDPKAAAWALDVSAEIAIHVTIRHNVTFLMTCLIWLSRCSGQCTQRCGKRTPELTRYFPMATIQASKWWLTTWRRGSH